MKILRTWLKAEHGRSKKLADHLGKTPSAITLWKNVPPEHVLAIEDFTGISRHVLRPDVFGEKPT